MPAVVLNRRIQGIREWLNELKNVDDILPALQEAWEDDCRYWTKQNAISVKIGRVGVTRSHAWSGCDVPKDIRMRQIGRRMLTKASWQENEEFAKNRGLYAEKKQGGYLIVRGTLARASDHPLGVITGQLLRGVEQAQAWVDIDVMSKEKKWKQVGMNMSGEEELVTSELLKRSFYIPIPNKFYQITGKRKTVESITIDYMIRYPEYVNAVMYGLPEEVITSSVPRPFADANWDAVIRFEMFNSAMNIFLEKVPSLSHKSIEGGLSDTKISFVSKTNK
jgi:hypothetical protein